MRARTLTPTGHVLSITSRWKATQAYWREIHPPGLTVPEEEKLREIAQAMEAECLGSVFPFDVFPI